MRWDGRNLPVVVGQRLRLECVPLFWHLAPAAIEPVEFAVENRNEQMPEFQLDEIKFGICSMCVGEMRRQTYLLLCRWLLSGLRLNLLLLHNTHRSITFLHLFRSACGDLHRCQRLIIAGNTELGQYGRILRILYRWIHQDLLDLRCLL